MPNVHFITPNYIYTHTCRSFSHTLKEMAGKFILYLLNEIKFGDYPNGKFFYTGERHYDVGLTKARDVISLELVSISAVFFCIWELSQTMVGMLNFM